MVRVPIQGSHGYNIQRMQDEEDIRVHIGKYRWQGDLPIKICAIVPGTQAGPLGWLWTGGDGLLIPVGCDTEWLSG